MKTVISRQILLNAIKRTIRVFRNYLPLILVALASVSLATNLVIMVLFLKEDSQWEELKSEFENRQISINSGTGKSTKIGPVENDVLVSSSKLALSIAMQPGVAKDTDRKNQPGIEFQSGRRLSGPLFNIWNASKYSSLVVHNYNQHNDNSVAELSNNGSGSVMSLNQVNPSIQSTVTGRFAKPKFGATYLSMLTAARDGVAAKFRTVFDKRGNLVFEDDGHQAQRRIYSKLPIVVESKSQVSLRPVLKIPAQTYRDRPSCIPGMIINLDGFLYFANRTNNGNGDNLCKYYRVRLTGDPIP